MSKTLIDNTIEVPLGTAPVMKDMIDVGDGLKAEAIYYNRPDKQVVCISTQLSCSVGCTFCASPDGNKTTNLTVEQMLIQIDHFDDVYDSTKPLLISFMGEGEPMLNIRAVAETIMRVDEQYEYTNTWLMPTRYAVSTAGPKPQAIRYLQDIMLAYGPLDNGVVGKPDVKLQWSLHSMFDEQRNELMPLARAVSDIAEYVVNYRDVFGQASVDVNYMLMDGINDSDNDASTLADFINLNGLHLKISQYNPVPWVKYTASKRAESFVNQLKNLGVSSLEYHITDGSSNFAACGQTRSNRPLLK